MELLKEITAILNFLNKIKYIIETFADESGNITKFVNTKVLQEWIIFKKFYIGDIKLSKTDLLRFIELKREQITNDYKYVLENKEWLCQSKPNTMEQTLNMLIGIKNQIENQKFENNEIILKEKNVKKTKKELEESIAILKQNIKDLEQQNFQSNNTEQCITRDKPKTEYPKIESVKDFNFINTFIKYQSKKINEKNHYIPEYEIKNFDNFEITVEMKNSSDSIKLGPLYEDPLEGSSKHYSDCIPVIKNVTIPNKNDPRVKTWNCYVKSQELPISSRSTPDFTQSDIELMNLTPDSEDSEQSISAKYVSSEDDYKFNKKPKKKSNDLKRKYLKPRKLFSELRNDSESKPVLKQKIIDETKTFYEKRQARIGPKGRYKSEYNLKLSDHYEKNSNDSTFNHTKRKIEKTSTITSENKYNEHKCARISEYKRNKIKSLLKLKTLTSESTTHKKPKSWIVPRKTPLTQEQYQTIVNNSQTIPRYFDLCQKSTIQEFFNLVQRRTEQIQENKKRNSNKLLDPLLNYLKLSSIPLATSPVRKKLEYDENEPKYYIHKQIKRCELIESSDLKKSGCYESKIQISDLEIYDEDKALQKALQMSLDDFIRKTDDVEEIGMQHKKKPIKIKDVKNFNPNDGDYKKYL